MSNRAPRSVYFAEDEDELVDAIAKLNATSFSFVLRTALRQMAGWPAATLTVPDTAATTAKVAPRT